VKCHPGGAIMNDHITGPLAEACGNAATSSQCYERIFQDMI